VSGYHLSEFFGERACVSRGVDPDSDVRVRAAPDRDLNQVIVDQDEETQRVRDAATTVDLLTSFGQNQDEWVQ